jgi:hypothetical protein
MLTTPPSALKWSRPRAKPASRVGDNDYHSNKTLVDLEAVGLRSYVSAVDRGRRSFKKKLEARAGLYRNRRRVRGRGV